VQLEVAVEALDVKRVAAQFNGERVAVHRGHDLAELVALDADLAGLLDLDLRMDRLTARLL
jgi:hypothetical protein